MPKLPSGKTLALSKYLILEPNNDFFNCPEGHFWYRTPDPAINRPPFEPGKEVILDVVHAPVPINRDEVKEYMMVLFDIGKGHLHWWGDKLSEFPSNGELDEADLAAWKEWLESESTLEFLDKTIERCRIQAESNRHNTGVVTASEIRDESPPDPDEIRLRQIGERVCALDSLVDAARTESDEKKAREIFDDLEMLLDETLAIRRRLGKEGGVGAYLEGHLNRVLRRWSTAEGCFREYLRSVPFHAGAWLELTQCLAAQGDLAEAEVAARQTVKVAPELAGAWGNLAMVLVQLYNRDEARLALDRALELDPTDGKNLYIDRHFDRYFEVRAGKRDDEAPRLQEVPN